MAALAPFRHDPVYALLLSAAPDAARGRISYLAIEPLHVVTARGPQTCLDGVPVPGLPLDVLAERISTLPRPAPEWPVDFRTGAIGYLGYELGGRFEHLPPPRPEATALPDMMMGIYDTVIAFDHAARTSRLLSTASPERRARIAARLAQAPLTLPEPDWSARAPVRPDRTPEEMRAAIARAIAYIHAGDIFQANITHRFTAERPRGLDDLALFQRLRALSPAPFAALLGCGADGAILSASPERFLRLSPEGRIETRPIKGTRPRHADPAQDAALAAELSASAKDRAENLMIVDLMRNDLGRVSELGSVRVPVLNGLETFASVHHLVSVVESRLRDGLGPMDLLRASFPGGSVTGAPKVRAMEIIHELEPVPRGPYCGAVAWIGVDGAMDSSIIIRTIIRAGDQLRAQAGGGIVADSDPDAEVEESRVKIAPLLRAIDPAG